MKKFYIWTIGCQMNEAESQRIARDLEMVSYKRVSKPEEANVVILDSCVVRQSAEDKVVNKLSNLKGLKRKRPDMTLALVGCMVGPDIKELKNRFPHVDLFLRPQQKDEFIKHLGEKLPDRRETYSPLSFPSTYIPIIDGCDKFCSYCIVPYRRGRERSRPMAEIINEVQSLAQKGVKEIILLGQNVDSYGKDLPGRPELADLLWELNGIESLSRIRFLTSHPKDMTKRLVEAVASLDKVCEHINLPVQAGDDEILRAMRRSYTNREYRELVHYIRSTISGVTLSTDVIVGFPGESEEQFKSTFQLLQDLRFDKVHVAAYSPRPGTIVSRRLTDNVPLGEKQKRLQQINKLQERISMEKNSQLIGEVVEVLVNGYKKGKWKGRTRTDKLVFFESPEDCFDKLVEVEITQAGPWSLQGKPVSVISRGTATFKGTL